MKAFVFLLVFLLCLVRAQAQTSSVLPLAVGDTLSNTDALDKNLTVTAGYVSFAIQPVVTKISGTVAGKVYVSSSLDNVNFIKRDSLVLADQTTNTAIWRFVAPSDPYWKVSFSTTGTQSYVPRIYFISRRHN